MLDAAIIGLRGGWPYAPPGTRLSRLPSRSRLGPRPLPPLAKMPTALLLFARDRVGAARTLIIVIAAVLVGGEEVAGHQAVECVAHCSKRMRAFGALNVEALACTCASWQT